MAFGDIFSSMADRFRQGPFHSADRENDTPNLANGGTSGFHPVNGRARRGRSARQAQQQPAGFRQGYPGGAPQTGFQQGYPGGVPQTGFQQGFQQAYQGAQQTGFRQGYPGGAPQTGFQQGFQQGYQGAPQAGFQQGYPGGDPRQGYPGNGMEGTGTRQHQRVGNAGPQMGSGYQGAFQANSQANRSDAQSYWPDQPQQPYQPKFGQEQQGERSRRFGREEQPQQQPAQDNISYMPNLYRDDQGVGHHHVERLTQPMSASTCYRLIEFMRNQESVIVNTELIPDERERQRCLDILFGAAYAMDCTFTRISVKSIYLIAPRTVAVISYESIRQMNEQDAAMRWPNVETEQPAAFRSFRAAK